MASNKALSTSPKYAERSTGDRGARSQLCFNSPESRRRQAPYAFVDRRSIATLHEKVCHSVRVRWSPTRRHIERRSELVEVTVELFAPRTGASRYDAWRRVLDERAS